MPHVHCSDNRTKTAVMNSRYSRYARYTAVSGAPQYLGVPVHTAERRQSFSIDITRNSEFTALHTSEQTITTTYLLFL